MKRIIIALIICVLAAVPNLYASQSTITETEGHACMGDDKSKKETEQAALSDARSADNGHDLRLTAGERACQRVVQLAQFAAATDQGGTNRGTGHPQCPNCGISHV